MLNVEINIRINNKVDEPHGDHSVKVGPNLLGKERVHDGFGGDEIRLQHGHFGLSVDVLQFVVRVDVGHAAWVQDVAQVLEKWLVLYLQALFIYIYIYIYIYIIYIKYILFIFIYYILLYYFIILHFIMLFISNYEHASLIDTIMPYKLTIIIIIKIIIIITIIIIIIIIIIFIIIIR